MGIILQIAKDIFNFQKIQYCFNKKALFLITACILRWLSYLSKFGTHFGDPFILQVDDM